jgi:hypothetical protein
MKALALAAAIACLALPSYAQTRVDLSAAMAKDFSAAPSAGQAVRALAADSPFLGLGWDVVMGHLGLGAVYSVDFNQDAPSAWWVDWEGQGLYLGYHLLEPRYFIDPFVDAGIGCAGRAFIGPSSTGEQRLALTIYPFVSAGAALELDGLRLGAKLSYALARSAIPATEIPAYPIGRFQVTAFAGISFGGR